MSVKDEQQKGMVSYLLMQILLTPINQECRDYALFSLLKDIKKNGEKAGIFSLGSQQITQQFNALIALEKQKLDKIIAEYLSIYATFVIGSGIECSQLLQWMIDGLQTKNSAELTVILTILSGLCATEYKLQIQYLGERLYPLILEYQKIAQTPEQKYLVSDCAVNFIDVYTIYCGDDNQNLKRVQQIEEYQYQFFQQLIQETYQNDKYCAKIISNLSVVVSIGQQDGAQLLDKYVQDVVIQLLKYNVLGEESTKTLMQSISSLFDDYQDVAQHTRKLFQSLITILIPYTVGSNEEVEAFLSSDYNIGQEVIEDDTTVSYEAVSCINFVSDFIGKKNVMLAYKKFINQQMSGQKDYVSMEQCIQYTKAVITCYQSILRKDEVKEVTKTLIQITEISLQRFQENQAQWCKIMFDIIATIGHLFSSDENTFAATHGAIVEILHKLMNVPCKRILNSAVTIYDDVLQSLDYDQVYLHNQLTVQIVEQLLQGDIAMQSAGISILTTYIQSNDVQNQTTILQQYLPQILQQYMSVLQAMKQQAKFTEQQSCYVGFIVEFLGILIGSNKQVLYDKLDQIIESVICVVEYSIENELDQLLTQSNQCLINISIQAGSQIATRLPQFLPKLIKILQIECRQRQVNDEGDEELIYDSTLFQQKKQVLFLLTQLCLNCPQQLKQYIQPLYQTGQQLLTYDESLTVQVSQLFGSLLTCIAECQCETPVQATQQPTTQQPITQPQVPVQGTPTPLPQPLIDIKNQIIQCLLKLLNPFHTQDIAEQLRQNDNIQTDTFDFISNYNSFEKSDDILELFVQVMKPVMKLDQYSEINQQNTGKVFDMFLICLQKQIQCADQLLETYYSDQYEDGDEFIEDEQSRVKMVQGYYQERMKQIAQVFNSIIVYVFKNYQQNEAEIITSKCYQVLQACYDVDCSKKENQYKFCSFVDTVVDVIENCRYPFAIQLYETYQNKIKEVVMLEQQLAAQEEEINIDVFRTSFYLYNCLCKFQQYKQVAQDAQILSCAVQLLEIFKQQDGDELHGIYDNIIMYLVNAGTLAGQSSQFFDSLFPYMQDMKGDQEEISNAISFCIDSFDKPELRQNQDIMAEIIVTKFFGPVYGFICSYLVNGYQNEDHDKYFLICNQKFINFYRSHKQIVMQAAKELNTQYSISNYQNFIQQYE